MINENDLAFVVLSWVPVVLRFPRRWLSNRHLLRRAPALPVALFRLFIMKARLQGAQPLLLCVFALALRACGAVTLFPMGDLWSYLDTGADLSKSTSQWFKYFYDDTAWPMAYGRFGNGNAANVVTTLAPGGTTAKTITYYFRKV